MQVAMLSKYERKHARRYINDYSCKHAVIQVCIKVQPSFGPTIMKVYIHAITPACKHTVIQVFKHTSIKAFKQESMLLCKIVSICMQACKNVM